MVHFNGDGTASTLGGGTAISGGGTPVQLNLITDWAYGDIGPRLHANKSRRK